MQPMLAQLFSDVAIARYVAMVVDVDGLERARFAAIQRGLIRSLDALCHVDVQVALWCRDAEPRAERLHRELPAAVWLRGLAPAAVLARLRLSIPEVRVIAMTDDPDLIRGLGHIDRRIPLARAEHVAPQTCWWLVDARITGRAARSASG